ncbi:hypothetical protein [Photobacterium leiognathi]|uniref:hypothetical protein n=1 Tax=Photobacterium leiognathi TaxID=553611 RepID=UPI0029814F88|nr:hypothetical protein [Photobacterium leiognathi]
MESDFSETKELSIIDNIKNSLLEPTVHFCNYINLSEWLENFDKGINRKIIEVVSRKKHILLEIDNQLNLNFYYSSPGTSTIIASLSLNSVKNKREVNIIPSWNIDQVKLHIVFSEDNENQVISSNGVLSNKIFTVYGNEQVMERSKGIENLYFVSQGCNIIEPSAIETWDEVKSSISILSDIKNESHKCENVIVNLSISMIITGFETYCKKRFLEIEGEGKNPNLKSLVKQFSPKNEDVSFTDLAMLRINFQDFDKCKMAFNKAYGIKFGELLLKRNCIENIKKYIGYRHRIIHVSPSVHILNNKSFMNGESEPVIPTFILLKEIISDFDEFISKLHYKSMC